MVRLMLLFDIAEKCSVLVDLDGKYTSIDGKFRGSTILTPFYTSMEKVFEKTTDPNQEETLFDLNGNAFKALILYKSSDPTSVYQRYHANPEEQKLDQKS